MTAVEDAVSAPTRLLTGDALEGTFLPLMVEHRSWPDQRWREELARLRGLGFDTLILQWSALDEVGFVDDGGEGPSTIERILAAADAVGDLDIYVGLSLRTGWWQPAEVTPAWLTDELSRNQAVAKRLHDKLRSAPAFRGWYVPHEYSEIVFAPEQREAVLAFYGQLSKSLRELDPLKPVLASGYTDPAQTHLVRFVIRWRDFLDRAGVDGLIFQDGAGIARRGGWRDILPYLEAMAILGEEYGGDVWFLVELFTQTGGAPIGAGPFRAEPAEMDRVRQQIEAAGSFRKKLIGFDYFTYMLPAAGPAASRLYDAYNAWLGTRLKALGPAPG